MIMFAMVIVSMPTMVVSVVLLMKYPMMPATMTMSSAITAWSI